VGKGKSNELSVNSAMVNRTRVPKKRGHGQTSYKTRSGLRFGSSGKDFCERRTKQVRTRWGQLRRIDLLREGGRWV